MPPKVPKLLILELSVTFGKYFSKCWIKWKKLSFLGLSFALYKHSQQNIYIWKKKTLNNDNELNATVQCIYNTCPTWKKFNFFYYTCTMIIVINIFLHKNFKMMFQIHMKKLKSHKVSNKFVPQGTWLLLRAA
jgi:hypothetical protein